MENLNDAFAIFEARTNLEKGLPPGNPNRVYRLDRMNSLCEAFGNPQDSIPAIHLAGSKGKGSTAACVAALSSSTGLKTGIYASPHLVDYRERFQISGESFPEEIALNTAREILEKLPDLEHKLPGEGASTTFELLTLFAFMLFKNAGCELTVIETGLGGRLDATNVISRPESIIITPIEKEHTDILGSRLSGIAAEKAGIFKPGVPVWSAEQKPVVRRVLKKKARSTGCELHFVDDCLSSIKETSDIYQKALNNSDAPMLFSWNLSWTHRDTETITLPMGGPVQARNAALALCTVRNLEDKPVGNGRWKVVHSESLINVVLPGRFHILRKNPLVLIDGAHTIRSIEALAKSFEAIAGENPILLFGSVSGKDHKGMAKILCGTRTSLFKEVIVSTPGTFKPSEPALVAESFRKRSGRSGTVVRLITDPKEAWNTALEKAGDTRSILVTGSFFMAGEIAKMADGSEI